MKNNHLSQTEFNQLNIDKRVLDGINQAGFTHCTPIQDQTLPIALKGKDVAGQAQTGTGKTAAFLIAAITHIIKNNNNSDAIDNLDPNIFILAPTRELAIQIAKDARLLSKSTELRIGLAYGGTDYEKQATEIKNGLDILIGTPGRIIDYYKKGVFKLSNIQVLVLDEADRMFDLGFIKDIRYLLRRLPKPENRLSMLFSATLSHRVMELAYEHMNEPALVRIEPEKMTADKIRQAIFFPSNEEKIPLLVGLIREVINCKTMVFINTKKEIEKVEAYLQENDIDAKAISGDVAQNKRVKMLESFEKDQLSVLIATDVASRGLHIPNVEYVINYDLPQDVEDYVHRIGRTARAGSAGNAISFGCETYAISLPDIEKYIGKKIPVANYDPTLLPELKKPAFKRVKKYRKKY
ncbi:MAG: RNA helicase [Woeseiaceae bacterium]|nr:RNA helicase [Woeseiaceae bacterium]|tara:strand:- start:9159 stop:10385 length:1227 start_codon:yes stop_codon:yes gene_type:complete